MGKFKMPSVQEFLKRKAIGDPVQKPWEYLEREMREGIKVGKVVRPYNHKVGAWLRFLRDLKEFNRKEASRQYKLLQREVGPDWFIQFSSAQIEVLKGMHENLAQDLVDGFPDQVIKALRKIGIMTKFGRKTLMKAIEMSFVDPGLFFWRLYEIHYKRSPMELMPKYSLEEMLMKSALVFIDYDDCVKAIKKIIPKQRPPPPPIPRKQQPKYYEPKVKYGMYLQKMYAYMHIPDTVQLRSTDGKMDQFNSKLKPKTPKSKSGTDDHIKKPAEIDVTPAKQSSDIENKAKPQSNAMHMNNSDVFKTKSSEEKLSDSCEYKIRLRGPKSNERLRLDDSFLKKREVHKEEKEEKRECTYPFWEAPLTLRDPGMAAYNKMLKLFGHKAKPKYLKYHREIHNAEYNVGSVTYSGGRTSYILNGICALPTGYLPLHGGSVKVGDEYLILILGFNKEAKEIIKKCPHSCDCSPKWEREVLYYLKETKCRCQHHYDLYNEGHVIEQYFYPATRTGPLCIDTPKLFRVDTMDEFIEKTVNHHLKSSESTVASSRPDLPITGMKLKVLLEAFLGDLSSNTALIIPHLPQANLLRCLQVVVQKELKGKTIPADMKKRQEFVMQRRWLHLKNMDIKALTYRIPFKLEEMENFTYTHYEKMQKIVSFLIDNFVERNKSKMIQDSRLWWGSMKSEFYPSKAFTDAFFAYMPMKKSDLHVLRPYSPAMVRPAGRGCGRR